jgi:hypothetical protein
MAVDISARRHPRETISGASTIQRHESQNPTDKEIAHNAMMKEERSQRDTEEQAEWTSLRDERKM